MFKRKKIILLFVILIGVTCFVPAKAPISRDAVINVPGDFSTIQAAITSANEGDMILVNSSTYYEELYISKAITVKGVNPDTTIIDGNGSYIVVDINNDDVIFEGFTVINGYYGLHISDSYHVNITDCIITNTTWNGIFGRGTNGLTISNCTLYDNNYAVQVEYYCGGIIRDIIAFSNTGGLTVDRVSSLNIHRFKAYNNDYGVLVSNSLGTSFCENRVYLNNDGVSFQDSTDFYVSRCQINNNTDDGIYFDDSQGFVTNCNITHNDYGEWVDNSLVTNKFCNISDNQIEGILNWSGEINSTDCWWGDSSGPYHSSENPSGTGNSVDDNVTFIPWQTSLFQPESLISELRCQLAGIHWKSIYPDRVTPKPLNRSAASVSDWLASSYMTTKIVNYVEGLDTDGIIVNQTTGEPLGEVGTGILCFGGPAVSSPVYYYEVNKIAPVIYSGVPGAAGGGEPWSQWYLANGSAITEAAMGTDEHNDLFLMESFVDNGSRTVVLAYGIDWRGTYAAGKFFDKMVFPNLATFNQGWVIVKWEDTNMNGFVDNPEEGDTYTVLAEGT
jgi:parallel beta-helix repeat protein